MNIFYYNGDLEKRNTEHKVAVTGLRSHDHDLEAVQRFSVSDSDLAEDLLGKVLTPVYTAIAVNILLFPILFVT